MNQMLFGGILSSICTGIGALPVLFLSNISHRRMDVLLAFTAGVMVAASTYGLIPSALKMSNLFVLCTGVLIGALVLSVMEQFIPHIDPLHGKNDSFLDTKSFMIVAAMTLHNLPEGLSVGVSYAAQDEALGGTVALAIGLQNAPEGLLIALFLINQKINRFLAIGFAFFTGSLELAASLLGFHVAAFASRLVPYGLAFAAGAMLFIVYKELIPETHGHGYERDATFSFLLGLLTMICLMVTYD